MKQTQAIMVFTRTSVGVFVSRDNRRLHTTTTLTPMSAGARGDTLIQAGKVQHQTVESDLQICILDFWLLLTVEMCSCLPNDPRVQATFSFGDFIKLLSSSSSFSIPSFLSSLAAVVLFDLFFTNTPGLEVAWRDWRELSAAPANTAEVAGGKQPKLPFKVG